MVITVRVELLRVNKDSRPQQIMKMYKDGKLVWNSGYCRMSSFGTLMSEITFDLLDLLDKVVAKYSMNNIFKLETNAMQIQQHLTSDTEFGMLFDLNERFRNLDTKLDVVISRDSSNFRSFDNVVFFDASFSPSKGTGKCAFVHFKDGNVVTCKSKMIRNTSVFGAELTGLRFAADYLDSYYNRRSCESFMLLGDNLAAIDAVNGANIPCCKQVQIIRKHISNVAADLTWITSKLNLADGLTRTSKGDSEWLLENARKLEEKFMAVH